MDDLSELTINTTKDGYADHVWEAFAGVPDGAKMAFDSLNGQANGPNRIWLQQMSWSAK